jgi:hypothetical protein
MAEEIVYDVEDKIGIDHPLQLSDRQEAQRRNQDYWRFAVFIFAYLLWWSWSWPWTSSCTRPMLTSETAIIDPGIQVGVPDIGFPESELRNWAQYSPYIPSAPYIPPPPGCVINQVSSHTRCLFSVSSIDKIMP